MSDLASVDNDRRAAYELETRALELLGWTTCWSSEDRKTAVRVVVDLLRKLPRHQR